MSSSKSTRLPQFNQAKRGRDYSPSKNVIYSPIAIEDDQKQIIVSKLKEQIRLLQKNSIELSSLKDHYKKLQHQFNLLQNEKKINDANFAKHHEGALKEICLMKNEIDSMKIQFRQKKLQLEDLTADQNTLKNQLDQKEIEISKLKNDLRSSIADNEELAVQSQKLNEIHRTVTNQRQKRADDCQRMKSQIDKIQSKIEDLTKYQINLQREQKALTEEVMKFQELNNNADGKISETVENVSIIETQITQSQEQVSNLQKKIAQTTALTDKFKNDIVFTKKSTQGEIMKNSDIAKNINEAENILKVRINQVREGHRELALLNEQNNSLQKINGQLEEDLEACRRHLQNLSLLNGDLVKNLQALSEQDQQVSHLIDRKDRVQRADQRVKQSTQYRNGLKETHESTVSSSRYSTRKKYY